jgi:hypothetical protein
MSEETTNDHNDGTWSGLRKTIIATISTVIAGGGTWLGVALFQGGESEGEEKVKTEQTALHKIILLILMEVAQPQSLRKRLLKNRLKKKRKRKRKAKALTLLGKNKYITCH